MQGFFITWETEGNVVILGGLSKSGRTPEHELYLQGVLAKGGRYHLHLLLARLHLQWQLQLLLLKTTTATSKVMVKLAASWKEFGSKCSVQAVSEIRQPIKHVHTIDIRRHVQTHTVKQSIVQMRTYVGQHVGQIKLQRICFAASSRK